MKTYDEWQKRYAEASFLLPKHVEAVECFLTNQSRAAVEDFSKDNLALHRLGGRAFWALVHTPPEPSDQIIVAPTGFGTGFNTYSVARAAAVREAVDPHATLVVQANTSLTRPANNFSFVESRRLQNGDFQPMRDQLNVVLDDLGEKLPEARVAYAGASLGAAITGSALRHDAEMSVGANAATIVDPANILMRGLARLGHDFICDIDEMNETIRDNFPDGWLQTENRGQERWFNGDVLRKISRVAILGEAHTLARALGHDQLRRDLPLAPKNIGIVHIWSERSNISPGAANRAIAEEMRAVGHTQYQPVGIKDPRSRHGVTVAFALQAAALEEAMATGLRTDPPSDV